MSLNIANQLATAVTLVQEHLAKLMRTFKNFCTCRQLIQRTNKGIARKNRVARLIETSLPEEVGVARAVINSIAGSRNQSELDGEAAFFACFLHGWRQDTSA